TRPSRESHTCRISDCRRGDVVDPQSLPSRHSVDATGREFLIWRNGYAHCSHGHVASWFGRWLARGLGRWSWRSHGGRESRRVIHWSTREPHSRRSDYRSIRLAKNIL